MAHDSQQSWEIRSQHPHESLPLSCACLQLHHQRRGDQRTAGAWWLPTNIPRQHVSFQCCKRPWLKGTADYNRTGHPTPTLSLHAPAQMYTPLTQEHHPHIRSLYLNEGITRGMTSGQGKVSQHRECAYVSVIMHSYTTHIHKCKSVID